MAGSDSLEHFGILGMHWGVRRERAADGQVRGPSKSTRDGISSDAARAKDAHTKVKTHGTDVLSNQDLQHLVNRMNLEQQYSRLTSGEKPTTKAKTRARMGKNFIKETIGVALMAKQVHEIANSQMTKDIGKTLSAHKAKKGG